MILCLSLTITDLTIQNGIKRDRTTIRITDSTPPTASWLESSPLTWGTHWETAETPQWNA